MTRFNDWIKAYPLDIFPEPDFKKAHKVLKEHGMTLDAISASNMRHVLNGLKEEFGAMQAVCKAAEAVVLAHKEQFTLFEEQRKQRGPFKPVYWDDMMEKINAFDIAMVNLKAALEARILNLKLNFAKVKLS